MSKLIQEVLKIAPSITTSGSTHIKVGVAIRLLAKEQGRRYSTDDEAYLLKRIEEAAGKELADALDSFIGRQIDAYEEAAFALGYYTAKHPEWLIFANGLIAADGLDE